MKKKRLDVLLVERGMAGSHDLAQKLIMAGQVYVNGQPVFQPASEIDPESKISIDLGTRYVSRGGEKLAAALRAFDRMNLSGKICADVGASTGGFTDCLLQHGAYKIYAIDVGYGELHWKLRNDPRVEVMERTNARYLERLPEPLDLVTIDASFISLKTLLRVVKQWFKEQGEIIALIKPQFEASREEAKRSGGVILDSEVHRRVLFDILRFAASQGFGIGGLIRSPLKGPKGNTEFLVHWINDSPGSEAIPTLVSGVLEFNSPASDEENSQGA